MTLEDYDRCHRWAATARTWFRKSSFLLQGCVEEAPNDSAVSVFGYDAARLLQNVLEDAAPLASLIPADELEDVERAAKELLGLLRARRLAGKLENVHGRTPAEAEAFRKGAARLRG
jgi:hypothetical protein